MTGGRGARSSEVRETEHFPPGRHPRLSSRGRASIPSCQVGRKLILGLARGLGGDLFMARPGPGTQQSLPECQSRGLCGTSSGTVCEPKRPPARAPGRGCAFAQRGVDSGASRGLVPGTLLRAGLSPTPQLGHETPDTRKAWPPATGRLRLSLVHEADTTPCGNGRRGRGPGSGFPHESSTVTLVCPWTRPWTQS